ncbi:MAG: hypothetical protein GY795_04895, partial [Desulfobacterales bacterium]|nr:hypothetical protein [Desulfobacterales bacterium]
MRMNPAKTGQIISLLPKALPIMIIPAETAWIQSQKDQNPYPMNMTGNLVTDKTLTGTVNHT